MQTDSTEAKSLWWRVYPSMGHSGRGRKHPTSRELNQEKRNASQWS